ncbi:histidine phosphatase family protein [Devriesea agamarum]|uniref:histidine phosphatase family protein n=1 Tax=Devriesea agamarum TaxID=472569 RepID=UPI00071CD2FF|nr:histidine phosphatase family protein [Devriesea agamarum]
MSGTKKLLLIRHGQTELNRAGRLTGRTDVPLSENGLHQAEQIAQALAETPISAVACSPLMRARRTAEPLAALKGLTPIVDERLIERSFGPWEGLTRDEIQQRWPQQFTQWRSQRDVDADGVEARVDVALRVGLACRELMAEHGEQGLVVVVAHGAAITLGVANLLGLDPIGFHGVAGLSNAHGSVLSPLHTDPSGQTMRLLSHNLPPISLGVAGTL